MNSNHNTKLKNRDTVNDENAQSSLNLLKLISQSENDIENNNVIEQKNMFNNLFQKLIKNENK